MLHGRIPHVQVSWVKLGAPGSQVMLQAGANDLGGTLMEETISAMAGSEHGAWRTPEQLDAIAAGIGRPTGIRTTTYRPAPEHQQARARQVTSYDEALHRRPVGAVEIAEGTA
jgi:FO synthase